MRFFKICNNPLVGLKKFDTIVVDLVFNSCTKFEKNKKNYNKRYQYYEIGIKVGERGRPTSKQIVRFFSLLVSLVL